MLTWMEMDVMVKKNLGMYKRKVASMINRKFYNNSCQIQIAYSIMSEVVYLTIGSDKDTILIGVYEQSNLDEDINIPKIEFGYYRIIFYDIRTKDDGSFYTSENYYKINNNMIVYDNQLFSDFCEKHKDLMFVTKVVKYMYKYLHLCKTTHYLANLDASYTLLLINKHQRIFPLDIIKIIINKLFFFHFLFFNI